MAHKESAKTAFNILSKNFDLIEKACYENNGDIALSDDLSLDFIDALVRNRLAYYIEGELYVRIHSKVRALVDHVSSRFRFREKHGEFASLLDTLDFALESYHRQKRKVGSEASLKAFDELREVVMDITELLSETVSMYNHFVLDDFSTASDIDERIYQTERCKNELKKINEIFAHLSVSYLIKCTASDPLVDHLLLKVFKRHLDSSLKELNNVNQKLIERLEKLHFDKHIKRLNLVLDDFAKRYADNPAYKPDFSKVPVLPSLCLTEKLPLNSYADFASPRQDYQESLALIAKDSAKKSQEKPPVAKTLDSVIDSRKEEIAVKQDPNETSLNYLFEAVLSDDFKHSVSARECYKIFNVNMKMSDWLFMVMNAAMAQRRSISRHAKYQEIYTIKEPFDGTKFIYDIVFIKD